MHYIIDGYNLLFYIFGSSSSDFKSQRESLIQALNAKIEFLGLDVSLVFDSHFSPGEGSRSHYKHLEIWFTPEKMTADDFIIQYLKHSRSPSKEVIVTNDRELSIRAKHLSAGIQSIDSFLNWLNKRHSNKKRTKSKPIVPFKPLMNTVFPIPSPPPTVSTLPSPKSAKKEHVQSPPSKEELIQSTPQKPKLISKPLLKHPKVEPKPPEAIEGSFDYYLSTFQTAHEAIIEAEKIAKLEKKLKKKRRGKC